MREVPDLGAPTINMGLSIKTNRLLSYLHRLTGSRQVKSGFFGEQPVSDRLKGSEIKCGDAQGSGDSCTVDTESWDQKAVQK